MNRGRELVTDFNSVLGTNWNPPAVLRQRLVDLLHQFGSVAPAGHGERRRALIASANWKFRFNGEGFSSFLDHCAELNLFFNYHDKSRIQCFFDTSDVGGLLAWAEERKLNRHLDLFLSHFHPISEQETLQRLAAELSDSENRDSILNSLFGAYVFHAFDERRLHEYFNDDTRLAYHENILDHLRQFYPQATTRNCALIALIVDERLVSSVASVPAMKDVLFRAVEAAYERLSNYCTFAVVLRSLRHAQDSTDLQWEFFSDVVLFAEKFREVHLRTGYFHPERIKQATLNHIPDLDLAKGDFRMANEGFFFKDSFVLGRNNSPAEESFESCDLLLLFDKNERDETLIPCPACRSKDVRGNSYPVLGVRSWECQNPLCPERSKYDRGNRYSLQSLLRQEAIEDPKNRIPSASLRRWKRDVLSGVNDAELLEMLARHYTFHGDTILLWNWGRPPRDCAGRRILAEEMPVVGIKAGRATAFFDSAFFHRFRLRRPSAGARRQTKDLSDVAGVCVFHGDAFETLQSLLADSVDGAVTSPPYYNAKSYASWPNIYCYLYDMFNVACEVHRVLKEGAPFLFNIFDYFDNENNMVFSAMGKKRMILGAYTVHLFRAAGFKLLGNVVWDKGEIEGKRNFNQGNHSPYYQAPFNCWEHIFVFSKGMPNRRRPAYPSILRLRPVFKMVNGENILGHSAPFPKEIPELLLERLVRGGTVLDPFSGSMTTGRAAYSKGFASISIDCHRQYCDLGLRLLENETRQLDMFKALALAERFGPQQPAPAQSPAEKVSYRAKRHKERSKPGRRPAHA